MKKPLVVVLNGRPGRPPAVKSIALRALTHVLLNELEHSPLIAQAVSRAARLSEARLLAQALWPVLNSGKIQIVSASAVAEMALLMGHAPEVANSLAPVVHPPHTNHPTK